jgi:hypothetical protein
MEDSMRRLVRLGTLGAALFATACGAEGGASVAASAEKGTEAVRTVFEFERLAGVPRPYTGATNAIRGVAGGGLPWVIAKGEAKLFEDGVLKVEVEGLVLDPNDATVVSRGLAGQNPIPSFKAIVSCRTVQASDAGPVAAVVNVETAPVAATTGLASAGGGNATIEQVVTLPQPCIAPIVFVTSAAGAWFAASGF